MATQPSSSWTGEKPRKVSGNGPGRGGPGGNGGRVFPTSPTGSAQDIHRAPPHSVEAEQGVLGSMPISPRDAIREVVEKINAVGEGRLKGQMLSMKDQVMEAIESIEKLYERKGGITGISTGFVEFDRMTSGMHPAEMIVIAARPSMGKTALAMNIAEHVSINEKLPGGVFSLEMSSQQLVQRLLCSRARVNLQKVRDGFLCERYFPSLTAAASKLPEPKLFIAYTPR